MAALGACGNSIRGMRPDPFPPSALHPGIHEVPSLSSPHHLQEGPLLVMSPQLPDAADAAAAAAAVAMVQPMPVGCMQYAHLLDIHGCVSEATRGSLVGRFAFTEDICTSGVLAAPLRMLC